MAVSFAHPPRQIGAGLSPDALGPEPVLHRAPRLVRTEVARQRAPLAARMLQVKTGVHHLTHISSEGKVTPEQGLDDTPLRVRQVARIASPITLVFLTIFVCTHFNLLLTDLNSPPGESVKQALSIFQDFHAKVLALNLTAVLASTAQAIVDDRRRDDSHPKQVNMTHALCAMKDALVRLLTRANPVELLHRLIEILADTVEPVRPGRSNPRRKGPRLQGYYMAYKPCS